MRGHGTWRGAARWLALVAAFGLLLFLYRYLEALAARHAEPFLNPFISELTGAVVCGALFFPVRRLVRRLPLTAATWPRRLPVYLAAMLACGAAATTLMWSLRLVLFPLAGLGSYDYGVMPLRYLMELPMQVIWFSAFVAILHVVAALDEARAGELRAVRIESSLARTQLRNLRLQLQPHFLFNALHTISAAMYDDPAAADEMLEQLAELLRSSLRTAQADEVPLGEELALLDRYLAIQRARFGDRLAVSFQIEEGTARLLVPSLLLQPLVENAIRHGNAELLGHGAITVRARTEAAVLTLEVENDRSDAPNAGGGAEPPPAPHRLGCDLPGIPTTMDPPAGLPGMAAMTTAQTYLPGMPATTTQPARLPEIAAMAKRPAAALARRGGDAGLGLAATAERLQLLYGEAQSFTAGPVAGSGGGFLVRATLPLRRSERPTGFEETKESLQAAAAAGRPV
jgi:two-component system LytT family sensor kinase